VQHPAEVTPTAHSHASGTLAVQLNVFRNSIFPPPIMIVMIHSDRPSSSSLILILSEFTRSQNIVHTPKSSLNY